MPQAPLRAVTPVGKLLRLSRKSRGWTLREVSERIAAQGEPFPSSTLAHVEQGRLEPGTRRLHLLLRLYDLSADIVTEIVELDTGKFEIPTVEDPDRLLDRCEALWDANGPYRESLAHYLALRYFTPPEVHRSDRAQYQMFRFAQKARTAGRFHFALGIVEEALQRGVSDDWTWRALNLASQLWNRLGSPRVALALGREAQTLLKPNQREPFFRLLMNESRFLLELGEPQRALRTSEHAIEHLKHAEIRQGEAVAFLVRVAIFLDLGNQEEALASARRSLAAAEALGEKGRVAAALFESGLVLTLMGRPEEAIEPLRRALALAVEIDSKSTQFEVHFRLFLAYRAAGNRERAAEEYDTARHFERHSGMSPYERRFYDREMAAGPDPTAQASPEERRSPGRIRRSSA